MMTLLNFFKNPRHYVARERLLHIKSILDMKIGAAHNGFELQTTEPEIDNNGHDFIISHKYYQLFLQNKATLDNTRVKHWMIHAKFLQASFQDRDLAPKINGIPVGGADGAFGGFLLHQVSASAAARGDLEVSYWYFDIIFANAIRTGAWLSKSFPPQEAEALLLEINKAEDNEKIKIPFKYMLPIRSPQAIIDFRMGIPSPSNWMTTGRDLTTWPVSHYDAILLRHTIHYWLPEKFQKTISAEYLEI